MLPQLYQLIIMLGTWYRPMNSSCTFTFSSTYLRHIASCSLFVQSTHSSVIIVKSLLDEVYYSSFAKYYLGHQCQYFILYLCILITPFFASHSLISGWSQLLSFKSWMKLLSSSLCALKARACLVRNCKLCIIAMTVQLLLLAECLGNHLTNISLGLCDDF